MLPTILRNTVQDIFGSKCYLSIQNQYFQLQQASETCARETAIDEAVSSLRRQNFARVPRCCSTHM